jgi:preprotein translocase subunit SecG
MSKILAIAQIITAVILIGLVLIQNKSGGLSNIFGGGGTEIYRTKRGLEKVIFFATIIVSIIFFSVAFTSLFF